MSSPDERSVKDARACTMCLAGMHSLCESDPCCCSGAADFAVLLEEHDVVDSMLKKQLREGYGLGGSGGMDGIPRGGRGELEPRTKGDSGYIHPDAWPSPRDIGSFDDPKSTGRKRQAEMYPIQKGQACEWASKFITLGDLPAIVGCVNNPATDLHHGPDKNTLNNESASRGVGVLDNTWAICSECHNGAHSKHDDFYPEYDRIAQQAQPWLPRDITLGMTYQLVDAPMEVLFAEEEKRAKDRARRGRTSRGRQAKTLEEGRFDVRDEA
jgi:hypothetical protein